MKVGLFCEEETVDVEVPEGVRIVEMKIVESLSDPPGSHCEKTS